MAKKRNKSRRKRRRTTIISINPCVRQYRICIKRKTKRRKYYQTGKRKSIRADRKRRAKAPGLRKSKSGRYYIETRRNRSDRRGSRL